MTRCTVYFEIPGSNVRILGSLHAFPVGTSWMPAWVNAAYDWSEALIHEHDDAHAREVMRSEIPLHEVLQAPTWNALTAAIPDDQDRSTFDGLRPWAALIALTGMLQPTVPGVEARLLPLARSDGKPVSQLETGADLLEAFSGLPLASIERLIVQAVRERSLTQSRLEAMHAAWVARDRVALYEIASTTTPFVDGPLREAAMHRRNRAWASKLRGSLGATQRTLVVVGAMHLCGPGNLEERLGRELQPA